MQDRNRNSFAWGGGGISIRPTMCLSACHLCPTTRSTAGRRDRNSQPKGFLNSLLGSIGDTSKTIGATEAIRPNWPVSLIRATATKPNDTRDHVREPLSPAFCVGACAARVACRLCTSHAHSLTHNLPFPERIRCCVAPSHSRPSRFNARFSPSLSLS